MYNHSSPLVVRPVRAFADNYIWLIEFPLRPGQVVGVGPGDAAPGLGELRRSDTPLPGHTLSHIAFWGQGVLFCGDTLFSARCDRMFEGTPTQIKASLNHLREL